MKLLDGRGGASSQTARLTATTLFLLTGFAGLAVPRLSRGAARVSELALEMPTYGFSAPNPIPEPETGVDRQLWPYFTFDGYTAVASPRSWTCVRLENDAIMVEVFPQIGGKIWGARDKQTGKDFLYRNRVVKFRNISTRGPWTSGGIEFNFGMLGHAPTASTPVDYAIRTNADGSASCFVGVLELITRTRWCVEIRLGASDRFFTTLTTWHNASGLPQPCYQWMNAAYPCGGRYVFPGSARLEHDGTAAPWPRDVSGRDLSVYTNNAFGPSKSYHVVNGDTGFFGVWWEENRFGSMHEAARFDRLGRKLWIWSLARSGAIWEDLLTDADGQYVELQSGRYFNQPARGSHLTPFKFPSFPAGSTITFTERWSPVTDARTLETRAAESGAVNRPLAMPAGFDWGTVYGQTLLAEQKVNIKHYASAETALRAALANEPHFVPALVCMADLLLHCGRSAEALAFSERALAVDAYHDKANYLSGIAFAERGDRANALDRFGAAALSPLFRSAAVTRIAALECAAGRPDRMLEAAGRALEANPLEFSALHLRLVALRLLGREAEHRTACAAALERFPLFHPARCEQDRAAFAAGIRCELPHEEILETAHLYAAAGLFNEAAEIAALAPGSFLAAVTRAYWLSRAGDEPAARRALADAERVDTAFAFPFRPETLPALEWARMGSPSWKPRYALALLLRHFGDTDRARAVLNETDADDVPFLLFRARLRGGQPALADIRKAQTLGGEWRAVAAEWHAHAEANDWRQALDAARRMRTAHPENPDAGILLAQSHLRLGDPGRCLETLKTVRFLPSEFTSITRTIYREACLAQAVDAFLQGDAAATRDAIRRASVWDERLGVGEPYASEIDTRLELWLFAQLEQGTARAELLDRVAAGFASESARADDALELLTALACRECGQNAKADAVAATFGTGAVGAWCRAVYQGDRAAAAARLPAASADANVRLLAPLLLR